MANIKKLAENLELMCPLWEDVGRKEFAEYGVDREEFISHEIKRIEPYGDRGCKWVWDCPACGEEHERLFENDNDFVYLGSGPANEGDHYKRHNSRTLCQAYMIQLRNTFGKEPAGAALGGKYERGADAYELVCNFSYSEPLSYLYALELEGNTPEDWSPAALAYLKEREEALPEPTTYTSWVAYAGTWHLMGAGKETAVCGDPLYGKCYNQHFPAIHRKKCPKCWENVRNIDVIKG